MKSTSSSYAHVLLFLLSLVPAEIQVWAQTDSPPNVLFIAIDDMNNWVGFLDGHKQADRPSMAAFKKFWKNANAKIKPPLE